MTNPFKSLPDLANDGGPDESQKNQIKENIQHTMRLKGFLFYLIEFFTAVFGASVADNLAAPDRTDSKPESNS